MRYLAGALNDVGYTVAVPRYPGHGTNAEDFGRTTWRDWLGSAVDRYLELSAEFPTVSVGGLSMGGAIGILLAARFPVTRLALYAPAIRTRNRFVPLAPILHPVVPPFRKALPERYEDAERQNLADAYWNVRRPRAIASLARLIAAANRALPQVTAPTMTVVSEADRAVPASVAERIERRVGAKSIRTVRLDRSGHVVTAGVDRERVAAESVAWFSEDRERRYT